MVLRQAKVLYMLEYNINDLALYLGIPYTTLHSRIYQSKPSWKSLRDKEQASFINKILKSRGEHLVDNIALTTQILHKYLSRVARRETEIDMKEAKLCSDILANIDRVQRLDEGKPTDIHRYELMSPEEVKREIQRVTEALNEEDPVVEYDA